MEILDEWREYLENITFLSGDFIFLSNEKLVAFVLSRKRFMDGLKERIKNLQLFLKNDL